MASKNVFISGEKAIRELSVPILSLISVEDTDIKAKESFIVTEEILKKATGLQQPDGMAAVIAMPEEQDLSAKNFLLILDGIQDPGNLGTLLRSALGLGWEGVVATPGTADFFNEKTLRAAQGAVFRIPYAWKTGEEIAAWANHRRLWVADLNGEDLAKTKFEPPLALVLCNEGQGPSPWARALKNKVSIPMENRIDSLNVASAGAILLYAMRLN